MYFVGLDLAWSVNNQSGIAIVDSDGTLMHVDAKLHEDDIIDSLTPSCAVTASSLSTAR